MICSKCNAKIKDESNFCSKCGTKCDTIATNNLKSNKQKQENEKHGTFVIPLIISIIGGLIAYLSVFHDAFGSASGFMAVLGGILLFVGIISLAKALGMSDEEIDAAIEEAEEKQQREKDIREANRIWNDAQRDYDRYNHSRK